MSRLMFDQTTGDHRVTKLTHRINNYTHYSLSTFYCYESASTSKKILYTNLLTLYFYVLN